MGGVSAFNAQEDVRHGRRSLTDAELGRLVRAAEAGPVRLDMDGPLRAMAYRMAATTGFRADELRSLTPESFRSPARSLASFSRPAARRIADPRTSQSRQRSPKMSASGFRASHPANQPFLFTVRPRRRCVATWKPPGFRMRPRTAWQISTRSGRTSHRLSCGPGRASRKFTSYRDTQSRKRRSNITQKFLPMTRVVQSNLCLQRPEAPIVRKRRQWPEPGPMESPIRKLLPTEGHGTVRFHADGGEMSASDARMSMRSEILGNEARDRHVLDYSAKTTERGGIRTPETGFPV